MKARMFIGTFNNPPKDASTATVKCMGHSNAKVDIEYVEKYLELWHTKAKAAFVTG